MSLQNEDIEIMIKMREMLVNLDKASVARALEWMVEWNKARPAPNV